MNQYLGSLIHADRHACWRIADQLLEADIGVLSLYQRLLQPALYRIGELWAANRISVAAEHVATAITEQLMNRVYPSLISPDRCGRKAVVALVEGELHQVGAKMVADVFEIHGWDSVFPGAGCSTDTLLSVLETQSPDVLGLSCSIFSHSDVLERMLVRVRAEHPDLPILLGGQGLDMGGKELETSFSRVTCLSTLDELNALLHAFGRSQAPGDDGEPIDH